MLILSRRQRPGQYQRAWDVLGGLAGRLSAAGDRAVYASAQERQNSEAGRRAFNQSEAVDAQRANACDTPLYIED